MATGWRWPFVFLAKGFLDHPHELNPMETVAPPNSIAGEIRQLAAAIVPILLPDPIDWREFTADQWDTFSAIDWHQFRLRLEYLLTIYLEGIYPAGAIHAALHVEEIE